MKKLLPKYKGVPILWNTVYIMWNATPIDVLCLHFVKFGRQEIGEIVRGLSDKKTKFRLALQISLLRGSRPKSARASPRQYTQSALAFIQICSLSAELYTREHRHSALESESSIQLKHSIESNNNARQLHYCDFSQIVRAHIESINTIGRRKGEYKRRDTQ